MALQLAQSIVYLPGPAGAGEMISIVGAISERRTAYTSSRDLGSRCTGLLRDIYGQNRGSEGRKWISEPRS
jgi:hypothetical protein